MQYKLCKKCNRSLPLTPEYYYRNKSKANGFSCQCKNCKDILRKTYGKVNPVIKRKAKLKMKFGITLEQYDRMFEKQNGVCKICGKYDMTGRRLAVDHDHNTGKIRALLCANCNMLLGRIESTPILFKKVLEYLKKYSPASLL